MIYRCLKDVKVKDYMPYNTKEKLKAYLLKNKEKIKKAHKIRAKRWAEKNKEKASLQKKEWALSNRNKVNLYKKKWVEKNKDKRAAGEASRRALKFRATIFLTKEAKKQIIDIYKKAQDKTIDTGYQWHVDHIVPLTKGGLHKPTNLQVVPASWNISKCNRNCDVYRR